MAKYDVYVFCNECGDVHCMGVRVELDDGPAERGSIGDTYAGKELPGNIVNLTRNYVTCPETNRFFRQKDNHQVFLVAVSD